MFSDGRRIPRRLAGAIASVVCVTVGGIAGATVPASAITCTPAAAIDHHYTIKMGQTLHVAAPGLLSGDTGTGLQMQTSWHLADPNDIASDDSTWDGNATIDYGASPTHRDLTGAFTYTPDHATPFTGIDSFDYYVVNSCGDTDWDTAYITVQPTVVGAGYSTAKNTVLHVDAAHGFLAHDHGVEPVTMYFDSTSKHGGTVADANADDGSFTYTPAHNYAGPDSFTYQVDDLNLDVTYTATVSLQVNLPNAPTSVTATPGNGKATVRFKAPTLNGGHAITNYVVTPYVKNVAQKAQTFGATSTAVTLSGLVNGRTYTFKVAAKNAGGVGPQSAASNAIVVGSPSPPSKVSATPGKGRATVHWSGAGNNGAAISAYLVIPYIGTAAQPGHTFPGTASAATITGLAKGKVYTFKVAAKNARGAGPQSGASNAVTIS